MVRYDSEWDRQRPACISILHTNRRICDLNQKLYSRLKRDMVMTCAKHFQIYFTILLATLLYYDISNVWPKYNSNSAVGWLAILWFVNLTIACFCIHWLCIGSKTSFTSYKFIMCKFYEHNHFHLVVTNYFVSISIQKHVNNNTALALFT